jgi:hypothetical protein
LDFVSYLGAASAESYWKESAENTGVAGEGLVLLVGQSADGEQSWTGLNEIAESREFFSRLM